MTDLDVALRQLARVPCLLIASDYDGTLAPIVDDPRAAVPNPNAVTALRNLAELSDTGVAVVSGRSLADLRALSGLDGAVHLVGSHGSEFDPDFASALDPAAARLRARLADEVRALVGRFEGAALEEKPASVAFHYRLVAPDRKEAAAQALLDGPAQLEGAHLKRGKDVLELSVVEVDKGDALETLRHRCAATAVLFVGDDVTDEDAFARLRGPDVGVKVGDGDTRARFRVRDTTDVARLLAQVFEARQRWLAGEGATPIQHHALLSDERTVALVTPEARITWLCLPRIDSSALFAELLGGPSAGYFSVRPAEPRRWQGQRYVDRTMVLETEWDGLKVTDFFDASDARPRQRAGRSDLIRILEGEGTVEVGFAPKLDYGRLPTRMEVHAEGLVVSDAQRPLVLRSPRVDWELTREGDHDVAHARIQLGAQPIVLDLRAGTSNLGDTRKLGPDRAHETAEYWRRWFKQLRLPGFHDDVVGRSALLLKALCYSPSGAISAAGTTSLPETIGGVRNWDYRFSWLRDGAMSASALAGLGSHAEGLGFLDWVLRIVERATSPASIAPLYTVSGDPVHPDAEIGALAGYRGSRPVRIGNSAAQQVQLDVFAPVVDLVHRLMLGEAPLSIEHWRLVEAMAGAVRARWHEPDHGIWEVRRERRHWVHSKVMCWMTIDRALDVARLVAGVERPEWLTLRDEIAADVLEQGWNEARGSFVGWYGSDEVDASVLWVGLSGLLPPDDPRFVATVDTVARELDAGPTIRRYLFEDGLAGHEGGFLLCGSWLVDALYAIGRVDEARERFHALAALAGPTGLLSEEWDGRTGTALGNVPQAYSHLGLIENALRLAGAPDAHTPTG